MAKLLQGMVDQVRSVDTINGKPAATTCASVVLYFA
jgi:hypothetical protein